MVWCLKCTFLFVNLMSHSSLVSKGIMCWDELESILKSKARACTYKAYFIKYLKRQYIRILPARPPPGWCSFHFGLWPLWRWGQWGGMTDQDLNWKDYRDSGISNLMARPSRFCQALNIPLHPKEALELILKSTWHPPDKNIGRLQVSRPFKVILPSKCRCTDLTAIHRR